MPGMFLNFPFDEEIFLLNWQAAVDPTLTAMVDSGAMQNNTEIARMIANGSNLYTIPFYNVLGGEEDNYDGNTNILVSEPSGGAQSGVVYGRSHGWKDRDFVRDFNSGANPMQVITSQVAKYWNKKRQTRMVGIMNGVFDIADDGTAHWDAWKLHTLNIATTGSTAVDANRVDATSAADAVQKAVGDNSGIFSLAFMHSRIALNLAKQNLLQFRKYTDPAGITRTVNIADWNGYTVIVDDSVPVVDSASASGEKEYTTYLLGTGALQHAKAPVDTPVEIERVVREQGGYNVLVNRLRETIHPNGFSYILPESCISPTDEQLKAAANWKLITDPKNIAMARIITNG